MDLIHQSVDFSSTIYRSLTSRRPGDGGLNIGGLVFARDLERFAQRPITEVLSDLAERRPPDARNVGGPAIVSLIHTAQLLPHADVAFFGVAGDDGTGDSLRSILAQTPVRTHALRTLPGDSPATYVFSDAGYQDGAGERLFVNQIGVADSDDAAAVPARFLEADIVQFGGTALVPPLHNRLPQLLERAREHRAFTVVNTVYDFRAERDAPQRRWTLGGDQAYRSIDLLLTDLEEARRLTGQSAPLDAIHWFLARGVRAAVVTCGADPVWYGTSVSGEATVASLPVYREFVRDRPVAGASGDTTGCGDNFCGGVVASIAEHIEAGDRQLDLSRIVCRGIASGALCLSYLGGTMVEASAGEKRELTERVEHAYLQRYEPEKRVDMPVRQE